jgi:hypothetical protein
MAGFANAQITNCTRLLQPVTTEAESPPDPPSSAKASVQKAQDQQENHGANKGVHNCGNDSDAEMNAKPWQQPISDECADEANNQIADQSKAAAFHHTAG